MTNIIQLRHAAKIHGGDRSIVAEVVTITPDNATAWLRCNRHNRPTRRAHIAFLADEILRDNWQVNGQAIVIAEDEQVLDGQHRLMAIIEAGKSIQTLVVYGISPEAFRTIDTGAVRTGADALCLHFPQESPSIIKCVATAVQWCVRLERGMVTRGGGTTKTSNTDCIEYVKNHPSLMQCAETLSGYPKDARPLSIGCGTALYEMFARKSSPMADDFMQRFYTGESLERSDPEWLLRQALIKDANSTSRLPAVARMRMMIKGWNWKRRGLPNATARTIAVTTNDDQKVIIL